MERTPRPQDITWFLDLHKNKQLDLDPPYQRKSVWTRGDKQFFLDTIFHNYPAPAVFLHKSTSNDGETVYHVVDGKQRLTTILEFVDGDVSIPKDFGDTRLAGKKWNELDTDAKKAFWNYMVTVEFLPDIDNAVVNAVFERINRNARKLTDQELRHAKFDGWLITRAEKEAEKQEWRDFGVVTTARAKRMNDVQFISEIILMTIRREIAGFDQDALDRAYADFDVPSETAPIFSEEEFQEAFEGAKRFLIHMDEANGTVARYGRTAPAGKSPARSLEHNDLLSRRCDRTASMRREVRRAIRAAGAKLWFLPSYSPDLNPIEQVFAKLKELPRKAAERTFDDVCDRIGALLAQFSPKECINYLRNAGYAAAPAPWLAAST